jgi:DNA-directed RNA polymerase specialized sigma24 family protein
MNSERRSADVEHVCSVRVIVLASRFRSGCRLDEVMRVSSGSSARIGGNAKTRSVEESASIDPDTVSVVLARLNPTYRAALVLRHVDGLSVSAVAGHLQRSVEATEQVLSRARAAFRDKYQGQISE